MELTEKEFERLVQAEMQRRFYKEGGELFAHDSDDFVKEWVAWSTLYVIGKPLHYEELINIMEEKYPNAYKNLYDWGEEMCTHTPSNYEDFRTLYRTLAADAVEEGVDSDCWYDIYLGNLSKEDLEEIKEDYQETDLIKFLPGVYQYDK